MSLLAKPIKFTVVAECSVSSARLASIRLPHADVDSPVFMPVGTKGTMKGVTTDQLRSLDCRIMLGNTYHLGNLPGPSILQSSGGLHNFMNWPNALLTDSGGFQMVSLSELCEVTEDGVSFINPYDKSQMLLTPEESIRIQNAIGADIMMQLDDVVHSSTEGPRVEEAMQRSIRWLDRCIAGNQRPQEQNLFAIIQGGLDEGLRKDCLEEMTKRDVSGFAIGGLSGGESKDSFWRMVKTCADRLPKDKPRYLMGVGVPVDLVVCVALGCDMFDCVHPTRIGRFGIALAPEGRLFLQKSLYETDLRPIDAECICQVCQSYSRAYLATLLKDEGSSVGSSLVSLHNLTYMMNLMKQIRESIRDNAFPSFIKNFMLRMYPNRDYPTWVVEALSSVSIGLS